LADHRWKDHDPTMKQNDPYAGLGTYEQGDADPYAGLGVVQKAMPRAKVPRTGMDKATQVAGVAANALLPYATAAGMGAMAGAPFAGVGAIPGAAGGVLALGLGDLGTSVYNLATPLFDGQRVPLPSETMQRGYQSMGAARAPETPGEQVFGDILSGAAGGGGQAKAFQTLAGKATSPQAQNFMRFMGQNIRGQTAAGAGAAAAPSVASNYFDVSNPAALLGLSLAGGGAGFKAGTPKTKAIPAAALKGEASKIYKQMEAANVNIAPTTMTDLANAARTKAQSLKYDPDTDKVVREALDLFAKKADKPISFDMLEKFRRSVRDLPYSEAGGKRGTSEERAIVKALDDTIDEFMGTLTPAQTTSGDAATASALLNQARAVRSKGYQTETLENAFDAATRTSKQADSTKSFSRALRDEFGRIAKNDRKLSKFDKPTQELIKKVANGTATQNVLAQLGRLAPSARLFGLQGAAYGTGATFAPTQTGIVAGLQGTGLVAKEMANKMSRTQAQKALASASGVKPKPPGFYVLSPIAQQNVLAQQRANNQK
jgi:hypothetical protein